MQEPLLFFGIDVAKDELVICSWPSQHTGRVRNDSASIHAWLKDLPTGALIGMESTGHYHCLLAHLAVQTGFTVFILNARDVFYYARALGARAKTDALDAVLIARYLAEHHAQLHPWTAPSQLLQQLHDLLTRRVQVVASRSALNQSLCGVDGLTEHLQMLHRAFERCLNAIDVQVQRLIDSDEQLAAGYCRLLGVTGFGPQTASLLAVLFSRFDFANADALVAYSGLDPRPDESGKRRGRRRLAGVAAASAVVSRLGCQPQQSIEALISIHSGQGFCLNRGGGDIGPQTAAGGLCYLEGAGTFRCSAFAA